MLTLTRAEAIDRLRAHLLALTDDTRSACQVAEDLGIFCGGFGRLDACDLRRQFAWLETKAHRPLTRAELKQRANQWQLARQVLHGVALACDAQTLDREHCRGWDTFSSEELARFHRELIGEPIQIDET